jgi:hypothetical protein
MEVRARRTEATKGPFFCGGTPGGGKEEIGFGP